MAGRLTGACVLQCRAAVDLCRAQRGLEAMSGHHQDWEPQVVRKKGGGGGGAGGPTVTQKKCACALALCTRGLITKCSARGANRRGRV